MTLQRNSLRSLFSIVSGLTLAFAYPQYNITIFAFIAFIPLIFAIENVSVKASFLFGWLAGFTFFALCFSWMAEWSRIVLETGFAINQLINLANALYLGLAFGLGTALFTYLQKSNKIPTIYLFAMTQVGVQSIFPSLFPFGVASGITNFTTFIQGADLFGSYGVSFMLFLVNMLLFQLIKSPKLFFSASANKFAVAMLLLWFGYGFVAINNWQNKIESWETKKIGIVQTNRPASLHMPRPQKGYSRTQPLEMEISKRFALLGADVILWPEGGFFGYSIWKEVKEAFHQQIDAIAVPLIFHDTTRLMINGKRHHYNSSVFLQPNEPYASFYHKMQLVPFGEYTPVIGQIPFFREVLGSYMSDLSAGTEHKIFTVGQVRYVPKLCYESLFPELVAAAIGSDAAGKVIVVQSQDGWYGESSQPAQHTGTTILRAVENRVPVLHSINNGPSSIITPAGIVHFQIPQFKASSWVGEMPFDPKSGGSFYSENPYLFIGGLRFLLLLLIIVQVRDQILAKAKQSYE